MGFAFVACSHETVYNENYAQDERTAQYEQAFIKAFGAVSPNETWDFSKKGSQLATARTRKQDGGGYSLEDWRGTDSYGYVWNYVEKAHVTDPMPESEVNEVLKKAWENTIRPAIDLAETKQWNFAAMKSDKLKIVFREFAVTRQSGDAKYYSMGISYGDDNYYLRMGSPANANDGKAGVTGDQHTSSLDFNEIPSNATWFTTKSSDKKSTSSLNALADFKEVTVTINNKDYTFWCFKCETNGAYTDLVLWVNRVPTVPVLVDCKRYFVEDLGGQDDFDFNDIVFDVALFSNGTQTCYIRALGGTLDITIKVGNGSWTKSDHYTKTEMINTTAGQIDYGANYGEFDATGWNRVNSNVTVEVEGSNGQKYDLPFPKTGTVPYIIAVKDGKNWRDERDRITDTKWFTEPNE